MKSFILIGCLIGGILALSNDLEPVATTYSWTDHSSLSIAEAVDDATNETAQPSMPPSSAAEAVYAQNVSTEVKAAKPSFTLQSVNDITLYDDPAAVIKKLGEPDRITQDPHLAGVVIYEYPNMNIVFSDEMVNFVELAEGAKTLWIDGIEVEATIAGVQEALGEPDYMTEDGIVFERYEALLKLFIDTDTQQLTSIHYFHMMSM
ncbi:hypothetical protein BK133_24495 [Paenibacillus sp. FSL H8-0548]|uniref:hypothetical protein n=1 Tax=Paenibacillus sp. FSL H8-0548 TaxID=1920422 RepID=UPI00096F3B7E|nr:hypothetical protein [Paenibacillus sp. FSL H8-0548]OMF23452.1 hypothetical protein BK133_24495 [Paenibacillus sp. FSL H8-0548]